MHVVHITHPTRVGHDRETLSPGESLTFGREAGGVGLISDDMRVSRQHGVVHATPDGFSVASLSTKNGFIVRDRATPSRMVIPPAAGPVPLPFRECSIVLEHCLENPPYLNVVVEGNERADNWHESWGPNIRSRWMRDRGSTRLPLENFRPKLPNGRVYTWMRTLVALCEPQFGIGPAGTPTNAELARRLFIAETTVERHVTRIFHELGIEGTPGARDLAVTVAVSTGAVTRRDLALLD